MVNRPVCIVYPHVQITKHTTLTPLKHEHWHKHDYSCCDSCCHTATNNHEFSLESTTKTHTVHDDVDDIVQCVVDTVNTHIETQHCLVLPFSREAGGCDTCSATHHVFTGIRPCQMAVCQRGSECGHCGSGSCRQNCEWALISSSDHTQSST